MSKLIGFVEMRTTREMSFDELASVLAPADAQEFAALRSKVRSMEGNPDVLVEDLRKARQAVAVCFGRLSCQYAAGQAN